MKTNLFAFLLLVFMTACSSEQVITIEVENTSDVSRSEEVVEICWQYLLDKGNLEENKFVILDESGNKIAYQLVSKGESTPQMLLFPATIEAESKAVYTIKPGTPDEFPVKTFGRAVPERKDDFAWENDRVVFRVYGPALAAENPSNGVDFWLKKTDKMIVDKFYHEELQNGLSYHVDRGEGLDCYKVGHTLGAGAIAPFIDNQIAVQGHYSSVRVLDSGALRTSFELTYDSILVGDKVLTEKLIVSLDAGSQFNKAEVSYSGDFEAMQLAAGIFLHEELGNLSINQENGTLAYAENSVSDAGVDAGRSYIGVVLTTPVQEIFQDNEHVAGVIDYSQGESLVYYFGGGWNQWGFDSDDSWFEYVGKYAQTVNSPLQVKIID